MRRKRPKDYISQLMSQGGEREKLGRILLKSHRKAIDDLAVEDLLAFLDIVQTNRRLLGFPQSFGKFRAYSLEEFVHELIRRKARIPKSLGIFWAEKAKITDTYGTEIDLMIGERDKGHFIVPIVAIDCKVELDASRLKTSLASFSLVKQSAMGARCLLVYVRKEIDDELLDIARRQIDGLFCLSPGGRGERDLISFISAVLADEK